MDNAELRKERGNESERGKIPYFKTIKLVDLD